MQSIHGRTTASASSANKLRIGALTGCDRYCIHTRHWLHHFVASDARVSQYPMRFKICTVSFVGLCGLRNAKCACANNHSRHVIGSSIKAIGTGGITGTQIAATARRTSNSSKPSNGARRYCSDTNALWGPGVGLDPVFFLLVAYGSKARRCWDITAAVSLCCSCAVRSSTRISAVVYESGSLDTRSGTGRGSVSFPVPVASRSHRSLHTMDMSSRISSRTSRVPSSTSTNKYGCEMPSPSATAAVRSGANLSAHPSVPGSAPSGSPPGSNPRCNRHPWATRD